MYTEPGDWNIYHFPKGKFINRVTKKYLQMILALFLDKGSLQQNLKCSAVQEKGNSNRTDQSQVVAWKKEFKILPRLV